MNIHGYCPHCKANLDGDLVLNTALEQCEGHVKDAIRYCSYISGWEKYGEANRWSRATAQYSIEQDRTISYRCPDCNNTWRIDESI